jgi:chromate transporter
VDINIGLHLFKSNAAGRKLVDFARAGSKLLPKGEMLILGGIAGAGIDGALKGIKDLLPDEQTPWIVGVILSLALFFAGHVFWPQGMAGRFDVVAVVISAACVVALFRYDIGVLRLLAACALVGLAVTLLGPLRLS